MWLKGDRVLVLSWPANKELEGMIGTLVKTPEVASSLRVSVDGHEIDGTSEKFWKFPIDPKHPVIGNHYRILLPNEVLERGDETACVSCLLQTVVGRNEGWVSIPPSDYEHKLTVAQALEHDADGWERVFRRHDVVGDKLNRMLALADVLDVYVEQVEADKDSCELKSVNGVSIFQITFLDSKKLDQLSEFLAESAQALRSCSDV